jgi:hypothetical protein
MQRANNENIHFIMSNLKECLFKLTANDQGFALLGNCCLSSPVLKPSKKLKYKLTTKGTTEFRQARMQYSSRFKPIFLPSAPVEQNPMLCAGL